MISFFIASLEMAWPQTSLTGGLASVREREVKGGERWERERKEKEGKEMGEGRKSVCIAYL